MGFGVTELIIVLVIVILLFGTKKLSNIGGDLGGALKSFRGAMKDTDDLEDAENKPESDKPQVIEGEVVDKKSDS